MITKHTQLLNYLIDRYGLKNYLEIGINNADNNYHKINLPLQNKVGVDPCLPGVKDNLLPIESDTFFKSQTNKFDIVFIDGLHHADQVKKDFENSLRCLNDNGFIVIHDTLPDEEIATCVPRGEQKKWFGDVYKWALNINRYQGIDFITLNADCGCTIAWKDEKRNHEFYAELNSWDLYIKYRYVKMNIVDPAQLMERLPVRVKEPVA